MPPIFVVAPNASAAFSTVIALNDPRVDCGPVRFRLNTIPTRSDFHSKRVIQFEILCLQPEGQGQMLSQCLHPVSLGGVVACGHKSGTCLDRFMVVALTGFASQVHGTANGESLCKIALGTPGAPAYPPHRLRRVAHQYRATP